MDLFTLVLQDDVAVDPRVFGPIVADALGMNRIEARILVKKSRGIFLEDVPEEPARKVSAALEAAGAPNWCVPNDRLPVLPAPRKVSLFERDSAALKFRSSGAEGAPGAIPWTHVGVVSIGAVALPAYQDHYAGIKFEHMPSLHAMKDDPSARELLREKVMLRMSDPGIRPGADEGPRRKADDRAYWEEFQKKNFKKVRAYADVVAADASDWIRTTLDVVAWVHEPGGVKFGEAYGFTYLAAELARRAPAAHTALSWKFVPGADITPWVFPTEEEFNRYTTWHAYRNALAATSSPSPAPPAPPTDGGSSSSSPAPAPSST